jgi:hypothetical protein
VTVFVVRIAFLVVVQIEHETRIPIWKPYQDSFLTWLVLIVKKVNENVDRTPNDDGQSHCEPDRVNARIFLVEQYGSDENQQEG